MPACVEPVTVHTTTWSKNTPSSRLLGGDLARPVGEAEPAERMVGGAGGDRVRLAARRLDGLERGLPAVADADVEAGVVEADVAAHDPGQLDVADDARSPGRASRPSAPAPSPPSRPRWRATPVTARVWLDCTPPIDTSVSQPWASASAARYSSLRTLLPPKAMPRVAVLALGPDLDPAAEGGAEPGQRMDRRRAEQQRNASEVVEAHRPIVSTTSSGSTRPLPPVGETDVDGPRRGDALGRRLRTGLA